MNDTMQGQLIITPYVVDEILNFELVQEINEHIHMKLTATITDGEKINAISNTHEKEKITVKSKEPDEIIFQGIVQTVQVRHEGELYQLEVYAVSNTIEMDIEKKKACFQDKNITYDSIIKKITKGTVNNTTEQGKKIGEFLLQYEETDWEFVKRLASHFNTGVVPNKKGSEIQYSFGLPEGKDYTLDNFNYCITKNIIETSIWEENEDIKLQEDDVVFYQVETNQFFSIGDKIKYQNKTLYVKKVYIKLENAVLKNRYWLTTKNGCNQRKYYNDRIIGLSLQAKVKKAEEDKIKVEFCIEEKGSFQEQKAWSFPYATLYTAQGSTGFYCMPEVDDTVLIYFPTKEAKDAVGFHSLRVEPKAEDKISNPDIKYLRTKSGKELKLAPEEILITGLDDKIFIQINEKTGIRLESTKPIQILTEKELSLKSEKNIILNAKKEIKMTCKSSNIKLDGSVTIEGKEIREN